MVKEHRWPLKIEKVKRLLPWSSRKGLLTTQFDPKETYFRFMNPGLVRE